MAQCIGIDTSNYTTSVAYFDGIGGRNVGRLLDVPEGGLGLRQSDALFQHVKRLPELMETLCTDILNVRAIGASTTPREVEGSYMPCFLAGESLARSLAQLLHVPFYAVSHQQGHIAAAAWSAGRMDLLDTPHLAWHLSGGTTELLLVEPDGLLVHAKPIGGTTDISAGQLIDRTGKRLGLAFPAGKAVDALSQTSDKEDHFHVKVETSTFSFSGLENKMNDLAQAGIAPAEICRFILLSILYTIDKATEQALFAYPGLPVLCAGGVASNDLLRKRLRQTYGAIFAAPAYSTDNAMGTAIFARRLLEGERFHG